MQRSLRGNNPASSFHHIAELDGFRGIAAVAVFFHHISFASVDRTSNLWNPLIKSICSVSAYGLYGVDLFFVLSGYLITSILLKDRGYDDYYFNFYWKRALRILPLYLISLAVAWLWFRASKGGVLVSVFFMANFGRLLHVNIAGPYWSLAIEEQFYLVWPRIVRRLTVDRIRKIAFSLVVVEPILRLVDARFHHYDFLFTFFRCDGLAFGALLACQLHGLKKEKTAYEVKTKRRRFLGLFLIGVAFLALAIHLMHTPRYMMQGSALILSALNLCFYCSIRITVEDSGSTYLAIFRSVPLVFFGEISYCMYMSHTYVMRFYDRWRGALITGHASDYWVRMVTIFCVTIALSIVSRYTIELPAMSLRKYILRKSAVTHLTSRVSP